MNKNFIEIKRRGWLSKVLHLPKYLCETYKINRRAHGRLEATALTLQMMSWLFI